MQIKALSHDNIDLQWNLDLFFRCGHQAQMAAETRAQELQEEADARFAAQQRAADQVHCCDLRLLLSNT